MPFELKPGMLLGTASSATQVDGGELNHTWNNWYARGHIKDGSDPARAADHWTRWREDILLMRRMGLQTCRFSVEWARVEPHEGEFDEEAIAHIREEILLMRGLGIVPLLTLHHFTNPMWFEARGGWENHDAVRYFLRYTEKIVRAVGHLVSEYITINEPNVFALSGYYAGVWPPGKKSARTAAEVMSVMAAAHIRAYRLIHELRRSMGFDDTRVGVAMHLRIFEPRNRFNPLHISSARTMERLFQTVLAAAVTTGRFQPPLKNYARAREGLYVDFHGINYYSRSTISGLADGVRENCPKNDLGWEIFPRGIILAAKQMRTLADLPVYITENGVCDNADAFRSRFLYDHLLALCSSDLPIERYYHWSFSDNFEWLDGESARFGLVHIDYGTQARSVKRSGEFYSAIIRNGGVTDAMYEQYVKDQKYPH